MAEIPESIMERATAVAKQIGLTPRAAHIDPIATALLAERAAQIERDAGIAEVHVICDWSKLPGKAVDDTFGKQIAAAIREQKT